MSDNRIAEALRTYSFGKKTFMVWYVFMVCLYGMFNWPWNPGFMSLSSEAYRMASFAFPRPILSLQHSCEDKIG